MLRGRRSRTLAMEKVVKMTEVHPKTKQSASQDEDSAVEETFGGDGFIMMSRREQNRKNWILWFQNDPKVEKIC